MHGVKDTVKTSREIHPLITKPVQSGKFPFPFGRLPFCTPFLNIFFLGLLVLQMGTNTVPSICMNMNSTWVTNSTHMMMLQLWTMTTLVDLPLSLDVMPGHYMNTTTTKVDVLVSTLVILANVTLDFTKVLEILPIKFLQPKEVAIVIRNWHQSQWPEALLLDPHPIFLATKNEK